MPNNKRATPRCLMCEGRMTPDFQIVLHQKVAIKKFGKVSDAFCTDNCAAMFAGAVISNDFEEEGEALIYKKRAEQLAECVKACEERGFYQDANRYIDQYNSHITDHDVKGHATMALYTDKFIQAQTTVNSIKQSIKEEGEKNAENN